MLILLVLKVHCFLFLRVRLHCYRCLILALLLRFWINEFCRFTFLARACQSLVWPAQGCCALASFRPLLVLVVLLALLLVLLVLS